MNVKNFTTTVLRRAQSDITLNLKLLMIWGAGVGGTIVPINDYIKTGSFKLTEFEIASIFCAVIALLIDEHKHDFVKLYTNIKTGGLIRTYKKINQKIWEYHNLILTLIDTLNSILYNITNIIGYAFLIPILPILWDISNNGINNVCSNEILIRVVAFIITSIVGNFIKASISKIIETLKQ
jgi:hypothetical protein